MRPLADLIVALVEGLPTSAGSEALGAIVAVASLELAVPVEARIGRSGELFATLPRGRMTTGFQMPHGRLRARFTPVRGDG